MQYRRLEAGEIIQAGDEVDGCVDAWRDEPVWKPAGNIGEPAPDPRYPAHRQYRRPVSLIVRAAQYAAACHAGQVRKYTGQPYITHPIRVAGRVATHPIATESLVAAAFLHDVMEDCGELESQLAGLFGEEVAAIVAELTDAPNEPGVTGINRVERKRRDRERIASISRPAKVIKLIDRIDNLREIDWPIDFAKVYVAETHLLLEVLREADEQLASEAQSLCLEIETWGNEK